jgi:hypothetical protein
LIKNLILLHLEDEAVVEALRQRLNKDSSFNQKECFGLIDYDGDGFLSVTEVKSFIFAYIFS